MAKLADFLSMEEVKEIVEYEEHEDEFDLEKEIVIGNEALSDLKLMQSIVAGLEEFTEEETQELTEFLNDKQEEVGYEKTEFTPENLDSTVEELSKDMASIESYRERTTFNKGVSKITYSNEDFSGADKFKKNMAGFFSAINVFGDKADKIKAKAERVLAMIEKEEGNTSKESIDTDAAKKLGFMPKVEGLKLAHEYIKFFNDSYVGGKRDHVYNEVLKDIAEWDKAIDDQVDKKEYSELVSKFAKNASKRDYIWKDSSEVTSYLDSDDVFMWFVFGHQRTCVGSMKSVMRDFDEFFPMVYYTDTSKVLKSYRKDYFAKAESKEDIVSYLKEVISFCDSINKYVQSRKKVVKDLKVFFDKYILDAATNSLGKAFMNAYLFVRRDIEYNFNTVVEMVEAGVDFCYDHYK